MMVAGGKKICTGCGDAKPATAEFFYRSAHASCGLQSRCKPCDCAHRTRHQLVGDTIYHQIARALGVTVSRVKQIEAAALRKLRRHPSWRALAAAWRSE